MKISSLSDVKAVMDYLLRIGAEVRSIRTAVVRENHGKYWKDIAVIRFSRDGNVSCASTEHGPTDLELDAIKRALVSVEWPELQPIHEIVNPPDMIRKCEDHNLFKFRNEAGQIVMVQVRMDLDDGDKAYVPWTYWDDDKWRMCEPEGPLPLYNADRLKDAGTVFIHEGAKAARAVQEMVDAKTTKDHEKLKNHPWGMEMTGAVHLGWVGGAMSPARTDWSSIMKAGIKRAYIISDNDAPGKAAVPAISQALRIPTFHVQFTDEFPKSFDLYDPFPNSMFGSVEGGRFYIGPSFRECLHPATWATDLLPPASGKGRPTAVLRDSFKGLWSYVEEADLFVCNEMPEILRPEAIMNKMTAAFSHVVDTSRLITKAYQGRSTRVCYRPDHDGLLVTSRGSSAINLHVKPTIPSHPGDAGPFIEFMNYLFVNPEECHEAMKWCATLIARPDIRMKYGLLLISEKQGVGKTTLGSAILAPLVGPQNVSWPSESDVTSAFNEWVANKRLAIVSEIYSGSSWKAYNALKAIITDHDVTVNQKYMRPYLIENWVHVFASSNSMRALKMENDDRRWFYPEVTETSWNAGKFRDLRRWIDSGGLSIIRHWAENFGHYVGQADQAPMTGRKLEMIEGSRSEAQKEAVAIAESVRDLDAPICLLMKDVVNWVRIQAQGRIFDTDYEIRRAMTDAGLHAYPKRIKVAGRLQYVIMNSAMRGMVQRSEDEAKTLRNHIGKCNEIMEGEM